MVVVHAAKQCPSAFEFIVDFTVGLAHSLIGQPWDLVGKTPVWTYRVESGQTIFSAYLSVDLTKSGRQVHNPQRLSSQDLLRR